VPPQSVSHDRDPVVKNPDPGLDEVFEALGAERVITVRPPVMRRSQAAAHVDALLADDQERKIEVKIAEVCDWSAEK
jgi:hypothetical protein